jgi:hypothetical protein
MRIREILEDMNYLQNSHIVSVFASCIASFISWRVYMSSNKIQSLEVPEYMTYTYLKSSVLRPSELLDDLCETVPQQKQNKTGNVRIT